MSAQRAQILDYSWLHDDTEGDLVGADWHQDAIRALSTSLKALAEERRWPWHVGDQLPLVGEKPDGTGWRPEPDISIHPTLGPKQRQNIDVRVEKPPVLVIEVASTSTCPAPYLGSPYGLSARYCHNDSCRSYGLSQ